MMKSGPIPQRFGQGKTWEQIQLPLFVCGAWKSNLPCATEIRMGAAPIAHDDTGIVGTLLHVAIACLLNGLEQRSIPLVRAVWMQLLALYQRANLVGFRPN